MASSSTTPLSAMDTPWDVPYPPLPPGTTPLTIPHNPISVINDLKPYSLRNGLPEDIEPYLLTAAIAPMYHWAPINNLAPRQAMRCVDGFIKSYLFQIARCNVAGMTDERRRKIAIVLGTCRAVITSNFELTAGDINPQELSAPTLSVAVPETGPAVFTALLPPNTPNIALLTGNLTLDDSELEVVKVLARCAQAIIPIQGLNLINDGHHYLSEKSKQSYKAFLAVERQVWVPKAFKDWIAGIEDDIRDWAWHKAGHPVAVSMKENAATSLAVKANLETAKLGSAAARLPALESDLRAAETYVKLAEAVGAIWGTMGGSVDCEALRYRVSSVKSMARSNQSFVPQFDMGNGVLVENRAAAINVLKATVIKNGDKAAVLYGFYCAMLDMGTSDMAGPTGDTLRAAFSLKKLRSNNIASYLMGVEMYKDYRAMRAAARKAADKRMPTYEFEA